MATVLWIAAQMRRAQINTITVSGTPAAGNVATVTINGKSVTYTVVTGDTTTTIAEGLADLLRATDNGEFKLITWTNDAAVITATAADPGVPFTATGGGTLTVASTGGGATTLTAASVQTSLSPNDAADVLNYSSGALPSGGDTLIIDGPEGIYWNLSALSALTILITVRSTFQPTDRTCWIGNHTWHPDLDFREFRGTELTLTGITTLLIEMPAGAPAGAYRFNGGSATSTVRILGAGDGIIGQESVHWRGTHATTNAIEVYGGSLLVDPQHFSATGTAVFQTLKCINAAVRLGAGVTVNTSADLRDSVLDSRVTVPTHTQNGPASTAVYRDAAEVGTAMAIDEGTLFWNSSGNIDGTLNVGSDGIIDFSGAKSAITVGSGTGTVVLEEGATYIDREKRTIASLGADTMLLQRTNMDRVNLDIGDHFYVDFAVGP